MRKRTLFIVTAALVGLGALALLIWALLPRGGTPIIIKGFGDPGGETTIDGSPDARADASEPKRVKKDHPTFDRISQLYVLNINEDKCVEYKFHESERPLIKIDISGAPGEIEIEQTLDNVHNLKFDDTDTYNKENVARKYKRKQPGVLQNVNTNASSRTKCYGKGGQKIEPCPTQVPTAGRTTIAVNYKDGDRCKPMD